MKHKTFLPNNKLRPYIQYYWTVNDDGHEHLQLSMADGFTCIRFFRGGEQSFARNIDINTTNTNANWKVDTRTKDIQTVSSGILGPRIDSYVGLSHSIISPDMTKLYVCGRYTGLRKVIFEIPIINGTPDYKTRTEIKVYPRQVPYRSSLHATANFHRLWIS